MTVLMVILGLHVLILFLNTKHDSLKINLFLKSFKRLYCRRKCYSVNNCN